jgi:outer membrane lipopolysaccharide assembly protein LptE/RlpB
MKKALLLLFCMSLSSCAYRFGPHQRQLPGGYQKIHVKIFENRTHEVGIESDFTNACIQELARTGVATVTTEGNAEVVLEAVIHAVSYLGKSAVSFQTIPGEDRSLISEYQTHVNVVFRLLDKQSKELWQGQILGERNYKAPQLRVLGLSTANPIYNQSARRQVMKMIAKDMATEVMSDMTENF